MTAAHSRAAIAVGLICGVALSQSPLSDARAEPGEVSGIVVDAVSGQPLAGVRLNIRPDDSGGQQRPQSMRTAADGRFRFSDLLPGAYAISAAKVGYATRSPAVALPRFELSAGQTLNGLKASLPAWAVVTGVVKNRYGDPVAGARVQAYRRIFEPGRAQWWRGGVTETNDLGEYRLSGLRPGRYSIMAVARPDPAPPAVYEMRDGLAFAPQRVASGESPGIRVRWGDVANNVDLSLQASVTTVVNGAVLGLPRSSAGAYIEVFYGGPFRVLGIWSRPDGTFNLAGLPPGRYRFRAKPRGAEESLLAEAELTLIAGRVQNLAVEIASNQTVSGRVTFEERAEPNSDQDGEEEPRSLPGIRLIDPSGDAARQAGPIPLPVAGGEFSFAAVRTGAYRLALSGSVPGSYLREIRRTGRRLDESFLNVTDAGEISDLELIFASDGGSVRGTVETEDGSPFEAPIATVCAVPERPLLDSDFQSQVSEDGSFQFPALRPGTYKLFAVRPGSSIDCWNPDDRETIEAQGARVEIQSREVTTTRLERIGSPK